MLCCFFFEVNLIKWHMECQMDMMQLRIEEIKHEFKEVLRGVEWVHGLFLFPLVLGKM